MPRWYIKVPRPPGPPVYPLYRKQSILHFPGVPHAQVPSINSSNCMPGSVPGRCLRHFEALRRNVEQCFSYFPVELIREPVHMQIPIPEVLATSEMVSFKLHVGRGCFLNGEALPRAESHLRVGSAGHEWPGRALGGQPGQGCLSDKFTGSIRLREMSQNLKSLQSLSQARGTVGVFPPLSKLVCSFPPRVSSIHPQLLVEEGLGDNRQDRLPKNCVLTASFPGRCDPDGF